MTTTGFYFGNLLYKFDPMPAISQFKLKWTWSVPDVSRDSENLQLLQTLMISKIILEKSSFHCPQLQIQYRKNCLGDETLWTSSCLFPHANIRVHHRLSLALFFRWKVIFRVLHDVSDSPFLSWFSCHSEHLVPAAVHWASSSSSPSKVLLVRLWLTEGKKTKKQEEYSYWL